jgi:hypothetical protein
MKRLREFYDSLTSTMSMTSLGVCVLSASLIFCGHMFWHFHQHDFTLLLWYFCSSAAVMVVYAIANKVYADQVPDFECGLIDARKVMRFIAWTLALSFLWCGTEQLNFEDDNIDATICLAAGPAVLFVFAVTYSLYATTVENDFKPDRTATGAKQRTGTARGTIRLIKVATFVALSYCILRTGLNMQAWLLLRCLLGFGVSLLVCTVVEAVFCRSVTLAQDRGVHALTEVSATTTSISQNQD